MSLRQRLARIIAPELRSEAEIKTLVQAEVERARASVPVTANYDPRGEGYRPMTGDGAQRRDLQTLTQSRMFEIAYFMYDHSLMTRGLAEMDKSFLFSGLVTVASEDQDVQEIIDRFWADNKLALDLPDWMMWLSLLGEQCWPVEINPHNGRVNLSYVDPAQIKDIHVNPRNVKEIMQVELLGRGGRSGRKMAVIREDRNIQSKTYGRLVGETFFFSINHPPNSPRGRSDFLTLFDWIDGLERYGFNYLERAEFMLNFIWDVVLKGMTEDQIRDWLRDNPAPQPGSLRAHNEAVEWNAVSPDLKAADFKSGFDLGKAFILGSHRRPDSWFGAGGKAYQTEAESMDQVPIKDLSQRQRYCKAILEHVIQFVVDQAVIAGRLSEEKAGLGFMVNMPEISKKDHVKLVNGVPQLATALNLAEQNGWISTETAAGIFAFVVGQFGMEIDSAAELEKVKNQPKEADYEDYLK